MKVGVLGAGAMGSGIAQVAAQNGHQVVLSDTSEKALKTSRSKLASIMKRLVEKGRIEPGEAEALQGRVAYSTDLQSFADCKLIIEAIVEKLEVKQNVFSALETIASEDCVLATNTSSLSVSAIAATCSDPTRVIGIHFFNPAPLMPLVEIVPALQTDPKIATHIFELVRSWGKLPVIAKDTPGFIVNRVARPFYSESLKIYEEGVADFTTIDWALKTIGGFRMGPFELMDFIGNDVNYAVTESVFTAFYFDPRYKPSFTQKRLSDAGWLGRKSGKGYYDYSEDVQAPSPVTDNLLGQEILDRVLIMLINEAADALFLNIATRDDIDLAMTKGVNYPKGLLSWADELGIAKCVDLMDGLYDEYHEDRYRCSPLLRRMRNEKKTFYD